MTYIDNMTDVKEKITVDKTAVKRVNDLREIKLDPALYLRVTVEGGGCSGFQYILELDNTSKKEDHIFEGAVVTDPISLPFLKDSVITFEEDLAGSEFKITNPNAVAGCGCGTSFSMG